MCSKTRTCASTAPSWAQVERLRAALAAADAVVVGAGSGLSAAAGFSYSGPRFDEHFSDFRAKYGFSDMYSGGFYPFPTAEERWAYWSRYVLLNRYNDPPTPLYEEVLALVAGKDHFVLTTNVDHCFQKAGADKARLFYTQGDYGLFQCAAPCCRETWDNREAILTMVRETRDLRVPTELLPRCPHCGGEVTMNLRVDDGFVEDEGWHAAKARYAAFLRRHAGGRLLFLELGVGFNSPGVIKYPFWRMTLENPRATYVCVNQGEAFAPPQLGDRAVVVDCGIAQVVKELAQ